MDYSVASIYGLPVGAYVVGVEPGFCAEKAGIQEKDIIVAVGEEQIASITDLTRALRDYEPGDRAKLTVYRAGQYLSVLVVLDERPAAVG
jgi:serine protease Do